MFTAYPARHLIGGFLLTQLIIMKNDKPILISFSGGRTSAFMTKFLLEYPKYKDFEKVICFANTGKENDQTLDFVNECDKRWSLGVVWLEGKVIHEKGKGTDFTIVDYETADRNGDVFEEVIKKYGIPSVQFLHCTRELKQMPIMRYMESLGYDDWYTALGIRIDEPNRIKGSTDRRLRNPFFPLAHDFAVDEKFIRDWWGRQDFDLKLKDYQGNCDLCYKKSLRKKMTIMDESPEKIEWWKEMERKYSEGGKYIFEQRAGLSIQEIEDMSKKPFSKAIDKQELRNQQCSLFDTFDFDMDIEKNCFCS